MSRHYRDHLNLLLRLGIDEALDGAPDQLEHPRRVDDAGVPQHLRVVVLVDGHDARQHPLDVPGQVLQPNTCMYLIPCSASLLSPKLLSLSPWQSILIKLS